MFDITFQQRFKHQIDLSKLETLQSGHIRIVVGLMNEKLQQITSMTDFNPARMALDTTTIWTIYLLHPLPCPDPLSTHAIGEWALELQT